VRLARGNVQGDARAHYLFPIGGLGYSFTLDHKNLMLIWMLMCLKDCPTLELNHAHGEVGSAFGLPDDPSNGLVLTHRLFRNVTIISTQHIILQN
jgi:hypothetical protein